MQSVPLRTGKCAENSCDVLNRTASETPAVTPPCAASNVVRVHAYVTHSRCSYSEFPDLRDWTPASHVQCRWPTMPSSSLPAQPHAWGCDDTCYSVPPFSSLSIALWCTVNHRYCQGLMLDWHLHRHHLGLLVGLLAFIHCLTHSYGARVLSEFRSTSLYHFAISGVEEQCVSSHVQRHWQCRRANNTSSPTSSEQQQRYCITAQGEVRGCCCCGFISAILEGFSGVYFTTAWADQFVQPCRP